jgi:hypothetical protein
MLSDESMVCVLGPTVPGCDVGGHGRPVSEDASIKKVQYNFVEIGKLQMHAANSMVDVIAVVKEAGPVSHFTSKAGKDLTKKDLTLVDQSAVTVRRCRRCRKCASVCVRLIARRLASL